MSKCVIRAGMAAGSLLLSFFAVPDNPLAEPQGGQVNHGDASISVSGNQTTIDQRSSKAIIDWQSFSLAAHESAVFNQPDAKAIALNRVTGNDPSSILGAIRANGQVWLINRNGVMFGPSATVDVQGLVATTADIPDAKFLADDFKFSVPAADPSAAVVNEGEIAFGDRGLAALVGSNVRNSGVIMGRLGSVVIAGTPTFTLTLDPQDGGLIQFAANSQITSALAGQAFVENSGQILNDGGLVRLTASIAAGVVGEAINTSGLIQAHGLALQDGRIELISNAAGQVVAEGSLNVAAGEAGARDGSVVMRGDGILLTSGARIDGAQTVDLSARDTMLVDGTIVSSDSVTLAAEHMTIAGSVTTDGDLRLRGKAIATIEDGNLVANRLDVSSTASPHHPAGGGILTLKTDVDEIAIGKTRDDRSHFREATVVNDGDLMIGEIDNSGIDVGRLNLQLDGTLSINRPIVADATGDAVVVVTGRFINDVGTQALQTPHGRALVYSNDPNVDDRGDLSGSLLFEKSFSDAPPGSISVPGNVFIYRTNPVAPPAPPVPLPAPVSQPEAAQVELTALQIAQVTQPVVVPASDAPQGSVAAESRLIRFAPATAEQGQSEEDDLLFANDGNRELWGLSRGVP